MSKPLIIITNNYPFDYGEPFLDVEIKILQQFFSKIYIISKNVGSGIKRPTSDDLKIIRYNPKNNFFKNICIPWLIFKNLNQFISALYFELSIIRSDLNFFLTPGILRTLIHDLVKAFQLKEFINKIRLQEELGLDIVVYSYWFDSSAIAISLLQDKTRSIRKISRAHRGEIYTEMKDTNYLSFQKWKILKLDKIFCISEHGKDYLMQKFKMTDNKCTVARLGVKPAPSHSRKKSGDTFILVSCSFIKKVKRIDLIIQALDLINESQIKWIHLGGGELFIEVKKKAELLLSGKSNIEYYFSGDLSHDEIIEFYSLNWVDLFINVSSSEGIPVSIMEALSFGIPVMATDVGGVREIINEENGFLLDVNSTPQTIASKLMTYINFSPGKASKMRTGAFQMWKENYYASTNYTAFARDILAL